MGDESRDSAGPTRAEAKQHSSARKIKRANSKRKGELSEAAFLLKATSLGFGVAKPWGDSERYDFILDSRERLWRVQVKSVGTLRDRAYYVNAQRRIGRGVVPYAPSEIDFLVAHVIPESAWFIIPVEAIMHVKTLRLYPRGDPKGEYRRYREAWQLMKPSRRRENRSPRL